MDWIKKRYDQFILVLAAVALLAVAALLFMQIQSFPQKFAEAQASVVPGDKIAELDLSVIKSAEALAAQPASWKPAKDANAFLFVPDRYIIDTATLQPKKPGGTALYKDSLTGVDIPSSFFLDNNLQLLDPAVANQDPDKDGFLNEDEWRGSRDPNDPAVWLHDSTNPNDANSHPPFITKLFLKQWIRVPFRLLFQAYDGDPTKPKEMSFQINAKGRGSKTEFLKLGEKVGGSRYRLESFEFKEQPNPKTGGKDDVSELTLLDTEFNTPIVLVKNKETDSPDSIGLLEYQITGKPIQVKKGGDFVLLPETDKLYKLVDIKEDRAVIQLPDGGTYIIVVDSRKK